MGMSTPDLPVREVLPRLRAALLSDGKAVLVAPPGAGKTTLVPPELFGEPWLSGRKVLMLEPRRLAARAAADRIGFLLGEEEAGGTSGYRVRHDTRVGPRTRIEVITEGVLPRMLQADPALEEVGLVIFDEFHERSLTGDLGLALTLHAREVFREDLRILVMSATMDPRPVADLLDGAPVITSAGRSFPVDTRYHSDPVRGWIEPEVAAAVLRAVEDEEGDVLAFLPGAREIARTHDRLRDVRLPSDTEVLPLFGNLPREAQQQVLDPSPPGRRKVVLATAIAETSLTIEGVRVVVDGGLMRVPRFDPGKGMGRLETVRVSRDAADQRRGRAGRTAPGVCYRLWTEAEDRGLVPVRTPEIRHADLSSVVLGLASWGAEADELRWLDPPPEAAWAQARELLMELDALDGEGVITEHGRAVAGIGAHPRIAHLLLRGSELGLGSLACDLAALFSERDVLRGETGPPGADLRLRVETLQRGRSRGGAPSRLAGERVDRGRLARVLREARHWRATLGVGADEDGELEDREAVGLLTAFAYPDRIAARRRGGGGRFLLRSGTGASMRAAESLSRSSFLVAPEVLGGGPEARIHLAVPIEKNEIEAVSGGQVVEEEEIAWDPEAGRIRARRRRMLGALTLMEAPLADPDPETVARALLDGVRELGLPSLPWDGHTLQLRERLHFLHHWDPEVWPDTSEATLEAELERWLLPFLAGGRTTRDLDALPLEEALLTRVPAWMRRRLGELAPTHLTVPSGSRIAVSYADPEAPTLSVRIQEVFGWDETPTLAGGRVPVTMELLSPARRPVQVTTDLRSFWRSGYFDVRKDLRGRYPKHHWPEDPLSAKPTRRVRPR